MRNRIASTVDRRQAHAFGAQTQEEWDAWMQRIVDAERIDRHLADAEWLEMLVDMGGEG